MTKILVSKRVIPMFMLIGALVMGQPVVAKTTSNKSTTTELMSKSTSESIKAMTSPQVQQVSTERSEQLHNNLMKLAVNQEEISAINAYENDVYSKYGSYAGAVILQHTIMANAIYTFLNQEIETIKKVNPELGGEFENNPRFFGTAPEHKEEIMNYVNSIASYVQKVLTEPNRKLNEEETLDILMNAYKNMGIDEQTIKFVVWVDNNTTTDSQESKMNVIAYITASLFDKAIEQSYIGYMDNYMSGAGAGRFLGDLYPVIVFKQL